MADGSNDIHAELGRLRMKIDRLNETLKRQCDVNCSLRQCVNRLSTDTARQSLRITNDASINEEARDRLLAVKDNFERQYERLLENRRRRNGIHSCLFFAIIFKLLSLFLIDFYLNNFT